MALPARSRIRRPARLGATALAVAVSLMGPGCQGFNYSLAQWRSAYDTSGLAKGITDPEKQRTGSTTARWHWPGQTPDSSTDYTKNPSTLVLGSDGWKPMMTPKADPKADAELKAAYDLYKQDKLSDAEHEFTKIAKNRKGTPWGEKAQFYLAEILYQQKKYVYAHDAYEKLFADYPGTEFLEKLVSREYEIAQIWLAQSDDKAKSDELLSWTSHFDGKQPIIDTQGLGLKALEHVRIHDPTGPLADDALMKIADYHMRNDDFESAGIYYDQLIQDHPKSPLAHKAHLAAIDARMKEYRGPEYDSSGLERSRELVKQTLNKYPDKTAENNALYQTLDHINEAEAEKAYTTGAYYKKIGRVQAAEYYFGKIPQKWPQSPWAQKAKTELASLAKMPRTLSLPSRILTQPGATSPMMGGMGGGGMGGPGMGGMGGMGMGGSPGGMM
jgi:outer membrane protein assembly factor BamD (BamD/ComL family)